MILILSQVWLCLGLSIVINAILWRLTYGPEMSFFTAVRHLVRSVVSQPISGFRKLVKRSRRKERKYYKKFIFLMLLAMWLMVTSITIRCISSVLLNSYLKLKP